MPTTWNETQSELPQPSSTVVLDSFENRVFAKFEQEHWLLDISPINKLIHCDLDCFPLWRYPTEQELRDFESLKLHNQLTRLG
ncbi:hypothetical protein FD724_07510 [Nostoc sp. C057]|uniref:hypothetical protein n=1 Tax=Nostoc sp. C057 TaxID=2576903 RepID=UPI0015C314D4|nr:hypothetical protein [Nostoc sp. C057]QLE47875.1 hypothetical protein FD724_06950 [Nostoc sp. C057]QLE47982.1 hypothetical protein FD724_07510 [Nostoc sp. C057]